MTNNDSITIMQKVEELKKWQKQYQARQGSGDGAFHSPSENQGRVREGKGMLDMSSPSLQLKAPSNLTMKSDILDLDNGIHMIDELLNRIQRKSTESQHDPSSNVSPSPPFHRSSLPTHSPPQRQPFPPSSPLFERPSLPSYDIAETQDESNLEKPKRPFLKRGEGLTRFRMTLNDFKKPVPKPSFAMSRFRKKTASRPVAVPDKRLPASQSETCKRPSGVSRPDLMSKAALTHLETWSNMFGSNQLNDLAEGCPNDQVSEIRGEETRTHATCSESSRLNEPTSVRYPNDQTSRSTSTDRFDQGPRSTLPLAERFPYHQTARSNIFSPDQGSTQQPVEMSPLTQHRSQISSELDRRKKKEAEEQKVFEMLEQRARDSSFTSTSSLVAKLMEDSVMSTPVKTGHPQNPGLSSGPDTGRTDKGSHVRFSEGHQVQTIEEVDESGVDRTNEGFTIEELPHAQTETTNECECESECDTQYSSSDEGEDIPSVEEAIKSYRTVLNRPAGDSGKPKSHSSLDEYLKLAQPLRSLPPNTQAAKPPAPPAQSSNSAVARETKNNAVVRETKNNAVVKETKQLLAEIRKLQEERIRRESEEADQESNKENERRGGGRGRARGSFPRTVYQETFQRPGGRGVPCKKPGSSTATGGLKSFGSEDPQPNPFEHTSEQALHLELLKKRLGDLENEIHVFRLENVKLNKERKEFEKDKAAFTRSRKASEKALQEEKEAFTREMEEEKNKLNKEKKVFLKYAKDARNFPSKPEREELSKLKEELRAMKEEMVKKETKWAAGQARLRNHVKVLEAQNLELKVQLEKMGKEAKKVSFASKKHISNTQIMNAINSQISKLTQSDVLPPPPTSILKKHTPNTTTQPTTPNHTNNSSSHPISQSSTVPSQHSQPTCDSSTILPHSTSASVPSSYNLTVTPGEKEVPMPEDSFDRVIYQSLYSGETRQSTGSEDTPSHDDDVIPIETLDLASPASPDAGQYKEVVASDGTRERRYSDGRQEIHYPNGNTLIVSEAGQYVKMFYYNGDIKETDSAAGTVRYFYSESNTWHTSLADGTETLEFSHGQRETRHRDGRVEIEYSQRGCRRLIGKDGTELWTFTEGPVETVEILADGRRELKLRNGQREIHTRDYKRREFPGGAVKLVYPDGVQETRYPNGRVRLKDGEGNLIMDSHEM